MAKLKPEPYDALELLWSSKVYKSEAVQNFIKLYDLSSGAELDRRCLAFCDWYEEAMLNNRYFYSSYINERLAQSEGEHLILILSADFSPISLEILKANYGKVHKIVEIDSRGMDAKQELYDTCYPQYSDKIKCINADLSSETVLSALNSILSEYYDFMPCIVMLQNSAFYFDVKELESVIKSIRSSSAKRLFLMEYLLPSDNLPVNNRELPEKIYGSIKEFSGFEKVNSYSREKIISLFGKYGGREVEFSDLSVIEKMRNGSNRYFNDPAESWTECAVFEI